MAWLFLAIVLVAWLWVASLKARKAAKPTTIDPPTPLLQRRAPRQFKYRFEVPMTVDPKAGYQPIPPVVSLSPPLRPPPAPRVSPATNQARWLAAGEAIEIAGFRITGGLIYVGSRLPIRYGGNANCLINPSLPVSRTQSDQLGATVPYWCTYEGLRPEARRSYLEWLSGGRCDPEVGICYVFLFFYGLEHRLFLDRAKEEGPTIVAEVRRLLNLYGAQNSFRNYATRLLDAYNAAQPDVLRPTVLPRMGNGYEISPSVLRYLGSRLRDGNPLDASDTLIWALSAPQHVLRTAGVRCFDELVELWQFRFKARYPNGLDVKPPKSRLKMSYRAASNNFDVDLALDDLPNIAGVTEPLRNLHAMLDGCVEDLSPFSRFIGKYPEAAGTIEAAALLPDDLSGAEAAAPLQKAREALTALISDAPVRPVELDKVVEVFELKDLTDPSGNARLRKVAPLLDRLDIGFEPDRRYGGIATNDIKEIVLFPHPKGCPVDSESQAYVAARTMVEISAIAALSDGAGSVLELDALQHELQSLAELHPDERLRLYAYAAALFRTPPKQQAAFSRLEKLPEAARLQAAHAAIASVLADGQILPGEVAYLERLYKALGLPKDSLYSALHRGAPHDGPVSVADAQSVPGVAIPAEQAAPKPGVMIDPNRLARIRAETAVVSSLLSGIFVEDAAPVPTPRQTPLAAVSAYPGLDGPHAILLEVLLRNGSLDRARFEQEARRLQLLPDGAIETINDWGFDHFDESLLDSDDEIVVQPHLRPQLETMGAVV